MKPHKKTHLDASLYRDPGWIYFFTIVSNFKNPFFLNEKLSCEIVDCLKEERKTARCKVYTYCLMPDHLHLLCSTEDQSTSVLDFINRFKGRSTRIGWKYGIEGSLWQRGSYDHILRREENLAEISQYIVNNPLRRGIVEKWEDYPFSGYLDDFDS